MTNKIIIKPEDFKSVFLAVVDSDNMKNELVNQWKNLNHFFLYGASSALSKIAAKFGLNYTTTGCNLLDAVFYEQKYDKLYSNLDGKIKSYSVAIEVEEKCHKSCEEMNKLTHFNAGLKVLITYPGNAEEYLEKFSHFSTILQEGDVFDDFSKRKNYLAIFGKNLNDNIEWKFYNNNENYDFIPI